MPVKITYIEDQKYGLPEQKKYPMPDKRHVISAIKFFNYVDPKYEKQLAKAIIARIKEYGMSFDDFGVGEDNRFSKYLPEQALVHHGILGQKWGIRRYQNPDGSLTKLGEKHRKQVTYETAKKDVDSYISNNKDVVDSIIKAGSEIQEEADLLGKKYTDAFNNIKFTDSEKNKIWESLHKDFGNGSDDEELYDWILEEHVRNQMFDSLPNSVKESRIKFEDHQDKYWNNVKSFTNDLIEKYDNIDIYDKNNRKIIRNGKLEVKEMIYGRDHLNTQWNSYISRHFDDYWVNDTDEYYNAINRLKDDFSMNKFNEKYMKNG